MVHEAARYISLSPKIPGSLVLKTSTWSMRGMFCLLWERVGWGLISPLQSQIFKSNFFQSNILKSNTCESNIPWFSLANRRSSDRKSSKDTFLNRRCAICKSSKRWRSHHLRICFVATLTSVGMCLNSFLYGCFLANIWFFRFLFYFVLLWVFRHEM